MTGSEGIHLRDHLETVTGRRPWPDVVGDRRLERAPAGGLGGADGPAGPRCRRHGPRVPRGPDGVDVRRRHLADPVVVTDERGQRHDASSRRRASGRSGSRVSSRWSSAARRVMAEYVLTRREARGAVIAGHGHPRPADRRVPRTARADPLAALVDELDGVRADQRQDRRRGAPHDRRLRARHARSIEGTGDDSGPAAAAGDPEREPRRARGRRGPRLVPDLISVARLRDRGGDRDRAAALRAAGRRDRLRLRSDLADAARSRDRRAAARSATTSTTCPSRSCMRAGLTSALGIDVGGTNTDAVVLDRDDRLLAKAKTPTTADVTGGIREALRTRARRRGGATRCADHARDARHDARHQRAARAPQPATASPCCASARPATRSVPPLFGWPDDLREVVSAGEAIVGGGIEFDGRELVPFDARCGRARFLDERRRQRRGGRDHERVLAGLGRARAEPRRARPRGARRRHARLAQPRDRIDRPARARERHRAERRPGRRGRGCRRRARAGRWPTHGLQPVPLLRAERRHADGPRLRAALPGAHDRDRPGQLAARRGVPDRVRDALVVDVGGTSTDVGVLVDGFPRESAAAVEIGGVRTNFRMPDSGNRPRRRHRRPRRRRDGAIGPDSVGFDCRGARSCSAAKRRR